MTYQKTITTTNDQPNKVVKIICDCDFLWSLAQQFSYVRLSDEIGEDQYHFLNLYAARARRIAATYARFYLEIEDGGDDSKLGRYYWMALGAFAVKTVACLLDTCQLKSLSNYVDELGKSVGNALEEGNEKIDEVRDQIGEICDQIDELDNSFIREFIKEFRKLIEESNDWVRDITDMKKIPDGLAKGNLWLFFDISPVHWFYNHYPKNLFNGMECLNNRNPDTMVKPVKKVLNSLPWAEISLNKINCFNASEHLIDGFEYVTKIEKMPHSETREEYQFQHLIAIAKHEQGEILQPLIYDDTNFNKWIKRQRRYLLLSLLSPATELLFTHKCSIDNAEFKFVAYKDLILEDFRSRMDWIEDGAEMFHNLMRKKTKYMQAELEIIAKWVDEPDTN